MRSGSVIHFAMDSGIFFLPKDFKVLSLLTLQENIHHHVVMDPRDTSLSIDNKIGIIVGVLSIGLALVAVVLAWYTYRRRSTRRGNVEHNPENSILTMPYIVTQDDPHLSQRIYDARLGYELRRHYERENV